MGHTPYTFCKDLLDEYKFIDAAGLIIIRHMVGEVSKPLIYFITLNFFTHQKLKKVSIRAQMWGATGGVQKMLGAAEEKC